MKKLTSNNIPDSNSHGFKFRFIIYLVISVIFALSVLSYTPNDLSRTTDIIDMQNYIGILGAKISFCVFYLIGIATYLLSLLLLLWGVRSCIVNPKTERKFYFLGILMATFALSLLCAINPEPFINISEKLNLGKAEDPLRSIPGGVIGQFLVAPPVADNASGILRKFIGYVGSSIFSWLLLMAGFVIIYLSDWHMIIKNAIMESHNDYQKENKPEKEKKSPLNALQALKEKQRVAALNKKAEAELIQVEPKEDTAVIDTFYPELEDEAKSRQQAAMSKFAEEPIEDEEPKSIVTPAIAAINNELSINAQAVQLGKNDATPNTEISVHGVTSKASYGVYATPNIEMLSKGQGHIGEDIENINRCKSKLQEALDAFKVKGRVTNHVSGPRVTRYEIILEPGVKVDKVSSLSNNFAMNLEANSVRILAPIPGKNAVGVEAPNSKSEAVFMRAVMESDAWSKSDAEIPIVLGKDVAGVPTILDLAKAPHLLIAGSTGSGKSVCMNTLIMSLLFNFSPDDLRLILVDPKVVEMSDYEKLPHLVTPVINDSKKVPVALRWAVNEMERRYQLLAKVGVKNLRGFNSRLVDPSQVDANGNEIPAKLPVLVIILDELADLMMTDAKAEVEYSISRIAAKGRAAGLHIVVATQRPSTTVITGVIKANLPTRIAFRVGSQIDSRVILDKKGGETLLGKGDMLFLPPGGAELVRIQGAMVDDKDIKEIVKFISVQRRQEFNDEVLAEESDDEVPPNGNEKRTELDVAMDEIIANEYAPIVAKYTQAGDSDLIKRALEIIVESRQASTSYLQRRMKIGYNKAAEIIDLLEARNIVGPPGPGGSKREILILPEIEGIK